MSDHTIQIRNSVIAIECNAASDADCRTELDSCLVVEQAEDTSIEFTEYYGGQGAPPPLVDGMPIDVSWDGEYYEWTSAGTAAGAA